MDGRNKYNFQIAKGNWFWICLPRYLSIGIFLVSALKKLIMPYVLVIFFMMKPDQLSFFKILAWHFFFFHPGQSEDLKISTNWLANMGTNSIIGIFLILTTFDLLRY